MAAISIVTPSLNQQSFIERTMRSVLDQDLGSHRLEYIVVDGGSTDGTLAVLRRYSDRLRWISEPDHGQADAVNKGIRATSGDIIGWLNSDDVLFAGAIRTAADYLEAHPDVDVVYGRARHVDEDDRPLSPYPTEPFDLARLVETCFLCQPAVFFRRRVVTRFGLLDSRLHYVLDYEYWLRLALGGARFAYIPDVLAGWRWYPGIKSRAGRMAMHTETNTMMVRRLGRVPDRWLFNYAHARLERMGIERRAHLRFAFGLAVLTWWAAIRWNHSVSPDVRRTTRIWLRDGIKAFIWSTLTPVRGARR